MGFFDTLFKKRSARTLDSESLREAAFNAVASGDNAQIETLVRTHRAQIADCFPQWTKVPQSGLEYAQDIDTETRLRVVLGTCVHDPAERRAHLNAASALNGNLVAAATARVIMTQWTSQSN